MKQTKEEILAENLKRFLTNAKLYNKRLKLNIPEEDIDIEKAKEITDKWYKYCDKKNKKEVDFDKIVKANREKARQATKKKSIAESKYYRMGKISI